MTSFAELDLTARTEELERAVKEIRGIGDEGERTERRVSRSTDRMSRGMGALKTAALGAASAIAAAVSVREFGRAASQYTAMTNTFRAMGQSAEDAATSLGLVADIANRTRSPLETTQKLYQRVSVAAGELGASQQDVLRFTENVGLALGSAGIGANEASGALLQLSQAMAGGVVRAEEFNSILENAFPLAQAAADGIDAAGGSVGKLRNLVVEGKVSSDAFFNAILSQSEELQQAFGNTSATVEQAFTVMSNNFTMMIGQMDAGLGVTSAIADLILLVGNNMEMAAGYVIAAAGAFTAYFVPSIYAAVAGLVTLKGALIATGIGAVVVAVGTLIGAFLKLANATGGIGNAFSALGDVASEVFGRIPALWDGVVFKIQSGSLAMRAGFVGAVGGMLQGATDFANGATGLFVGAFNAVIAAWGELPQAFSRFGALAINGLIDVVEGGVSAIITPLNSILEAVKLPPIPAPDLSGWRAEVPEAANIGAAIGEAFAGAQKEYIGNGLAESVKGMADDLMGASEMASQLGDAFLSSATKPIAAIAELRDKIAEVKAETSGAVTGGDVDAGSGAGAAGGSGGVGAAGGAGAGGGAAGEADLSAFEALRERLQTEREIIEEWRQETIEATNAAREQEIISTQEHKDYMLEIERLYQEQLGELQRQQQEKQLGEAADFFGAMASVAQAGGEKFARVQKVFAASQALINTLLAQTQVLADPNLGFFGKLAAYAKIGAAGLGVVSAIKSGGDSAASAGGASGSGSRQATPEPAQARRSVRIEVEGEGMFAEMLRGSVDEIADALFDNSRGGGTPIVVGRS